MTREEALALLQDGPEGIQKWNEWRKANPDSESIPDLSGVDLTGKNLSEVNFMMANLTEATLIATNLHKATLLFAKLDSNRSDKPKLRMPSHFGKFEPLGLYSRSPTAPCVNLMMADLSEANISYATLRNALLNGANLSGACLLAQT